MTKKLTYRGLFKSHLLADELFAAFPAWTGVTSEGTSRMKSKPDGTEVHLFVPDAADEGEIQVVIDAHDPNVLSVGEQNEVKRNQDDQDLADRYVVAMNFLDNTITEWPLMTAKEKQQWLLNNFDDVLKILRAILRFVRWLLRYKEGMIK